MPENTCQASVFTNSTSENSRSSGSARTSSAIDASSWPTRRPAAQRTIDTSPKPTTPRISASSATLAAAVTSALVIWPPNTSGSTAGTITNPASSTGPTSSGTASGGRPRRRLIAANAHRTMASPPAAGAQIGPHRPVQVDGAEHLADEHQRQQRDRSCKHVAGGGVILDEEREAGAPETAFVVGLPGHRPYFTFGGGRRPYPCHPNCATQAMPRAAPP